MVNEQGIKGSLTKEKILEVKDLHLHFGGLQLVLSGWLDSFVVPKF